MRDSLKGKEENCVLWRFGVEIEGMREEIEWGGRSRSGFCVDLSPEEGNET